jgi:purine-binding chemotaxis protein CheW
MDDVHVRLRVGEELYAVPVAQVREITELGALAPVPGAGAGLLGLRNLNGRMLPVFDLALVFGVQRDRPPTRIIVAESGRTLAGLAVDEVTDVGPVGDASEQTVGTHLRGAVLEGGVLVGIVDLDQVFATLELEDAA